MRHLIQYQCGRTVNIIPYYRTRTLERFNESSQVKEVYCVAFTEHKSLKPLKYLNEKRRVIYEEAGPSAIRCWVNKEIANSDWD